MRPKAIKTMQEASSQSKRSYKIKTTKKNTKVAPNKDNSTIINHSIKADGLLKNCSLPNHKMMKVLSMQNVVREPRTVKNPKVNNLLENSKVKRNPIRRYKSGKIALDTKGLNNQTYLQKYRLLSKDYDKLKKQVQQISYLDKMNSTQHIKQHNPQSITSIASLNPNKFQQISKQNIQKNIQIQNKSYQKDKSHNYTICAQFDHTIQFGVDHKIFSQNYKRQCQILSNQLRNTYEIVSQMKQQLIRINSQKTIPFNQNNIDLQEIDSIPISQPNRSRKISVDSKQNKEKYNISQSANFQELNGLASQQSEFVPTESQMAPMASINSQISADNGRQSRIDAGQTNSNQCIGRAKVIRISYLNNKILCSNCGQNCGCLKVITG